MSTRNKIFSLLALILLCACSPKVKPLTTISGSLPDGLDEVEIHAGELDTLLTGTDGRFEIELPTDAYNLVVLESGPALLHLIADGTSLELVLSDSSTVRSLTPQISLQERFNAFRKELSTIEDVELFKSVCLNTINNESDNVLGAVAFQTVCPYLEDEALGQALRTLSIKARSFEPVALLERLYNSRMETSEACLFRDFTVKSVTGYDYGIPLYTRFRLSDFVGQGQFALLFVWNSRDQLSLEQLPFIKQVYRKYGKKGLNIVGVSVLESPEDAIMAVEQEGIEWINLNNADGQILELYGTLGLPLTVYFAPDGSILNRDLFGEDLVAAADHYFSTAAAAK